jgi:hypothetical protein
MADDSQTSTPSNINFYNVASDDALWVLETDHEQLLHVLADPAGWVKSNVKIGSEPAILWEPFVVVFHEIPASVRTPSVHTQGVQSPVIHVKGIHETAVLTVRYSRSSAPPPPPVGIVPDGEVLAILQVGQVVHTHLELRGFTPLQVASSLFNTVTSPEAYIQAINALPQTLNGVPTPADKKLVFQLNPATPTHVVYQGWTPKPTVVDGKPVATPNMGNADTCSMSDGDANSQGQVIVNGIIVKTYTLPPPPPGPGG